MTTPMTRTFFFLGTCALLAACSSPATSTPETPVADTTAAAPALNYYGDTISAEGAMDMAAFPQAAAGKDSLDATLNCEIITSCTKKGCWMDVKMADGTPMKVRFRDYGFFVPTEGLEGKQATMKGRAVKEITDVASLKHYAEDAGQTPEEIAKITEPDTSWTFTADGVIIRN